MSIQAILQQLLQSGQGLANDVASSTGLGQQQPHQNAGRGKSLLPGGFTGGALTGGVLGLLLGNKKFRKMGGKVAAYGGMAAIGAVAYRAYQDWQNQPRNQPSQTHPQQPAPQIPRQAHAAANRVNAPACPAAAALPITPQAYAQLPAPEIENDSRNVLAAMITAAKADGHIGPQEQQLLDAEFKKLQGSEQDQQWIAGLLAGPADPAAIAKLATTAEQGAEIYLASLLITDADSFMERAYLDELARQLGLPPDLKQHLENTAQAHLAA
ncbi:tellurite resistance TerB family protein [Bordetella sp. LUAb4]|uniref:tellurite resistance TerB family protein n=1 Tax=Bordetella sp. LUAb4 TaxID=2843195 RepID=UPI001E374726|nr:tellurite resistance TerB family protein [Bordetella sp. LUAb4]